MTERRRRLGAEVALVAIAAVWGLTFVMVQDAIEVLPTMAFLGYRFLPAALIVAVIFQRPLRRLSAAGWRAGALMGAFLTAGYIFQTLGLEQTTASNAGFITGLFVVLTPLLGAIFLRDRLPPSAWAAAAVSALGLFLLSGAGGDLELARRWPGAAVRGGLRGAHPGHGARRAGSTTWGRSWWCSWASAASCAWRSRRRRATSEAPEGSTVWSALIVTSLVASALGFFVQTYAQQHAPPERTALILASEPAFAGLFGYLLADERLSAVSCLGALLILMAIVAVEVVPRMRPPRPLPEG